MMIGEPIQCPFCGGEARFEIDTDGSFMLEVEHESWCFLTSMDTRRWYYCETVEEAAQDWNQRAERTCKPKHWNNASGVAFARGECSECGGYLLENSETGKPRPYCPHCGAKVVE